MKLIFTLNKIHFSVVLQLPPNTTEYNIKYDDIDSSLNRLTS